MIETVSQRIYHFQESLLEWNVLALNDDVCNTDITCCGNCCDCHDGGGDSLSVPTMRLAMSCKSPHHRLRVTVYRHLALIKPKGKQITLFSIW